MAVVAMLLTGLTMAQGHGNGESKHLVVTEQDVLRINTDPAGTWRAEMPSREISKKGFAARNSAVTRAGPSTCMRSFCLGT